MLFLVNDTHKFHCLVCASSHPLVGLCRHADRHGLDGKTLENWSTIGWQPAARKDRHRIWRHHLRGAAAQLHRKPPEYVDPSEYKAFSEAIREPCVHATALGTRKVVEVQPGGKRNLDKAVAPTSTHPVSTVCFPDPAYAGFPCENYCVSGPRSG